MSQSKQIHNECFFFDIMNFVHPIILTKLSLFFILFSLFYFIPVLLPCYLSISSPSSYDFQQSKDEEGVASAETLKQKMKGLFSREGNVEPSSDGADYQNSPEKAVAKTRTVSTKQIFA